MAEDAIALGSSQVVEIGASQLKPARVGVLILHGINTTGTNYSDKFREHVRNRLVSNGVNDAHDVCFEEAFWGALVKSGQSEIDIANKVYFPSPWLWSGMRAFVLRALADAAAYQDLDRDRRDSLRKHLDGLRGVSTRKHNGITYDLINDHLTRHITNLSARVEEHAPLVIVAHSFGGQIASSYIGDVQAGLLPLCGSSFQRLQTVAGVITFGFNIPAFSFSADPAENWPISIPPQSSIMSEFTKYVESKGVKCWQNFFDPDDVLGFPLGTINEDYRRRVHDINVATKAMPWDVVGSHTGYWTHKKVISRTADYITMARHYRTPQKKLLADAAAKRLAKLS